MKCRSCGHATNVIGIYYDRRDVPRLVGFRCPVCKSDWARPWADVTHAERKEAALVEEGRRRQMGMGAA